MPIIISKIPNKMPINLSNQMPILFPENAYLNAYCFQWIPNLMPI